MMHDVVLRPQRILSLCSGAGGLDVGVHDALGGCARTVVYVEHEATACEVLAARIADGALDDAPIWGDLHAFDARPWRGRVDGIIGGYPCQPFSVAGKRLGTADPRHLWPRISTIIRDVQPRWCFFENVRGHVRIGLREVRADLLSMGYDVHAGIFSAAEVGAPHQRERLFILAHAGHGERFGAERAGGDSASGAGMEYASRSQRSRGTGSGADSERWAAPGPGAGDSAVADATLGGQRERRQPSGGDGLPDGGNEPAGDACGSLSEGRVLRGGAYSAGREESYGHLRQPGDLLPPFPPGPGDATTWQRILAVRPDLAPALSINEEWELGIRFPLASPSPKSEVRGVANGLEPRVDLSRTAQLRITGNGVVPQCAALAFRTLWGQLVDDSGWERHGADDALSAGRNGALGTGGQLADAGHTEREGGAMRAEAKGKHAMSLHHAVEGWSHEAP